MRPTAIRSDGMPGPKTYNPWWGDTRNLKQRGIITYTLSPFRSRATKDIFQGWLFNGYRRLAAQLPYWIVPFAIGYGTYTWAKRRDAWQSSKAGHLALHGHESH